MEETNLTPQQLAAAAGAAPAPGEREIDDEGAEDTLSDGTLARDPFLTGDTGEHYRFFDEKVGIELSRFEPATRNMRALIDPQLHPKDAGLREIRNILSLSEEAVAQGVDFLEGSLQHQINPAVADRDEALGYAEDWLFWRGAIAPSSRERGRAADDVDDLHEEVALRAIGQQVVMLAFPVLARMMLGARFLIGQGSSGLMSVMDAGWSQRQQRRRTLPLTLETWIGWLTARQTVGQRLEGLTGEISDGNHKVSGASLAQVELPSNVDDVIRFSMGILFGSGRLETTQFPLMLLQQQQQQQQRPRPRNKKRGKGGGAGTRG